MSQTSDKTTSHQDRGQFALLRTRRFGPFFWTQFCGAFNDNLFKTALAVLLAYQTAAGTAQHAHLLVNLAAALFILPFFLFSALAGQLADKYEKSFLVRRIKMAEIAIMAGAGAALVFDLTWLMLVLLFCMGAQSAFFGPVKYSLLPQHLKKRELVGGNGMVEMGTFVAILLGTMAGGSLITASGGRAWVAVGVLTAAVAGWRVSRAIPRAGAGHRHLAIRWNIFTETRRIVGQARQDRPLFMAMLAISWFWFLGAAYITQLPNFVRQVLHGQASVVTLMLVIFSIGVALGSLLCERLSGRQVELGLIPLGCLGMSLFGWDLSQAAPAAAPASLLTVGQFASTAGSWRVLLDLAAVGVCGGLYIVPLFAFIQTRVPARRRSRMIAANNVLNALFMVISSALASLLLGVFDFTLPQFFALLAAGNLAVTLSVIWQTPRFALRLVVWALTRVMYRVRCQGLEQIPARGAAILVCNHVSYVDALIIAGSCRRPVRFVMHVAYYDLPLLKYIFRLARVIPIDSGRRNPMVLRRALDEIGQALQAGELVCLFPEGHLTRTGRIQRFRPGIERIIRRNPVPVVPLALRGLWGSVFSLKGGAARRRRPRRFRSAVELAAGRMVDSPRVAAPRLQAAVEVLHNGH